MPSRSSVSAFHPSSRCALPASRTTHCGRWRARLRNSRIELECGRYGRDLTENGDQLLHREALAGTDVVNLEGPWPMAQCKLECARDIVEVNVVANVVQIAEDANRPGRSELVERDANEPLQALRIEQSSVPRCQCGATSPSTSLPWCRGGGSPQMPASESRRTRVARSERFRRAAVAASAAGRRLRRFPHRRDAARSRRNGSPRAA